MMKHLLRPYLKIRLIVALAVAVVCLSGAPRVAGAQAQVFAPFFEDPSPSLARASAAGYLGVDVTDVDAEKAQTLKLKEVRGAVITLIDHDAPAGQIGLKVNDVVLAINGQNVEGAEALRRMLREIPPGRKISLEISRDGNIQTLAVQLVDRKAMEHDIWSRLGVDADGIAPTPPVTGMGLMPGGDAPMPPSGMHMPLFTSTLNVGALVEPLTSQMADYLGVSGGLMIKQVGRKSEAAVAGFKAFDVILKVGADSIATVADWDRALRSNQGKPVQVTILRDKKQQNLTLQVDSKHHSTVEYDGPYSDGDAVLMADSSVAPEADADLAQAFAAQARAQADAASSQADALSRAFEGMQFQASPEQMEQLRQQTEQLREAMKSFKIDSQQMDQLRQQMDLLRKGFSDEQMRQFQQQMEKFREQMQQWQDQNCFHCV
jgi:serine protease Do